MSASAIFQVVHRTRYDFEELVRGGCTLEAHLVPRSLPGQRLAHHQIVTRPRAAQRRQLRDEHGNPVHQLTITEPFRRLDVSAVSVVELAPEARPGAAALDQPWETAAAACRRAIKVSPFAGERQLTGEAAAYASSHFPPGRPLGEAYRGLLEAIRQDFTFDTTATAVTSPLPDVLRRRRGVCQDFATVAIAGLRAMGLAARYVSGYVAAPTRAGRSHAWVSLHVPGHGWWDGDPTRGGTGPLGYITLGWGRGYAEVAPLQGAIDHGGPCRLHTTVSIEPASRAVA